MSLSKAERTASIQKSIETREKFPISHFDSRKYIQHNLNLPDGLGPILAFMDGLPADRTKVDVHRCFEDGDFSVAHADYVLGDWGPMVGFEVHRWQDERIVEHWDNLQPTPATANPSGRSMTDGVTAVEDAHRTAENKALVERFTTEVLIGGDLTALSAFFDGDALIQHGPAYADGVVALREQLGDRRYVRTHRVLGQGSMVLVISEGRDGDQSTSLYDLYRVASGRIVEHWDVVETIPPRDTWRNDNGKF
jgi:predicted SnoaL-like aldol condensation-catalyzing enzyme